MTVAVSPTMFRGAPRVLEYLWRRVSERVLGVEADASIDLPAPAAGVDLLAVTTATLDEVFARRSDYLSRAVAVERLRRGDVGMAAVIGDRIVASCWMGSGLTWRLPDLGMEVRLDAIHGVLYDAHTAPEYRQMGVMALLVRACVDVGRAGGRHWWFARVTASNTGSIRTLKRAGFHDVLALDGVVCLGMAFLRLRAHGKAPLVRPIVGRLRPQRPGVLVWNDGGRLRVKFLMPWSGIRPRRR